MKRLAVVRDFREELWPSMDLVADKLLEHWPADSGYPKAVDLDLGYRRLATQLPLVGSSRFARNFDRARNRYRLLPSYLRTLRDDFAYFHVADHSYAHLVHELPAERTGVYCHDLDAFRSLIDPATEPRGKVFRRIAGRILTGLQRAAVVFHNSRAVGDSLVAYGLLPRKRLCWAPLGVDLTADGSNDAASMSLTAKLPSSPYLLHVGTCIPRKRIEVLLDVFAAVRRERPDLKLVKAGTPWTAEQQRQIDDLNLAPHVIHLGLVERGALPKIYRDAAAVLVPSEAEGFGLPVIEALAEGAPVVASDIPTLREAGGPEAAYVGVGDIEAWKVAVLCCLQTPRDPAMVAARRRWAGQYSWPRHAQIIADAYRRLAV